MIIGDHGQNDEGWHDPYGPSSTKTPMIVFGKGIKRGKKFDYAEIIDLAPTIAYCAQVPQPQMAAGRVLQEIFRGNPDRVALERWMQRLNLVLVQHRKWLDGLKDSNKTSQIKILNDQFYQIDTIGTWHRFFDSLPDLVRHNEDILRQMMN